MTDDITNDLALLDDWLAGKGYGEEAGLAMRAMDLIRKQADEIEKLRKSNDYIKFELEQLSMWKIDREQNEKLQSKCEFIYDELLEAKGQVDKLRAALKPFAIAADEIAYSGTDFDELTSLWHWHDLPTLRDLRAAKAALGESDE